MTSLTTTRAVSGASQNPETLRLILTDRSAKLTERRQQLQEKVEKFNPSFQALSLSSEPLQNRVTQESDIDGQLLEEDMYLDCEDNLAALAEVNEEQALVATELQVVDAHIDTQKQFGILTTLFKELSPHISEIVRSEGTTFLSTLITALTGGGYFVNGTGVLSTVAAVGLGVITANELLKMLGRYLNKAAADDHLQALNRALTDIELKRTKAQEINERASALLVEVGTKIANIAPEMEAYGERLRTASSRIAAIVQRKIDNLNLSKKLLLQQKQCLETAIQKSTEAGAILLKQSDDLDALRKTEFNIRNDAELKAAVQQLENSIATIEAQSKDAYEKQLDANDWMVKALEFTTLLFQQNAESSELIAQLQAQDVEIDELNVSLSTATASLHESLVHTGIIEKELVTQRQVFEDQRRVIEIAKGQVARIEQNVGANPMMESVAIGTWTSAGTGAIVGAAIGGPAFVVAGGLLGLFSLQDFAARTAHRVRQLLRVRQLQVEQQQLTAFRSSITSRGVARENQFEKKVQFGEFEGSVIGKGGVMTMWNVFVYFVNRQLGQKMLHRWLSKNNGELAFKYGDTQLTLNFDNTNPNYETYGAISLHQQQEFVRTLDDALDKGAVDPRQVLVMIGELSEVIVEGVKYYMIRPDTDAIKPLLERCGRMIALASANMPLPPPVTAPISSSLALPTSDS